MFYRLRFDRLVGSNHRCHLSHQVGCFESSLSKLETCLAAHHIWLSWLASFVLGHHCHWDLVHLWLCSGSDHHWSLSFEFHLGFRWAICFAKYAPYTFSSKERTLCWRRLCHQCLHFWQSAWTGVWGLSFQPRLRYLSRCQNLHLLNRVDPESLQH